MARPVTRTEVLEEVELEALRKTFGSCVFAFRELKLDDANLNYPTFYRAWGGRPVTPSDRDKIMDGFHNWSFRLLQSLREREKAPIEEVA